MSTFRWFREFAVQSESEELAEIFKSWRFFIFLYLSLKGTAFILQITNNQCLRGNVTRINQFLSIPSQNLVVTYMGIDRNSYQNLVRHLGWNFLRVLITAWARGLFLLEAAPRMFEWVVNMPLILLKPPISLLYVKRPTQNLVRCLEWICLLE